MAKAFKPVPLVPARGHIGPNFAFVSFSFKTPPRKKAPARWADEVEQRHPREEQGDDGDGDEDSNDIFRHGILQASLGGGLRGRGRAAALTERKAPRSDQNLARSR